MRLSGLQFIPSNKHPWLIKSILVNHAAGSGSFLFKFSSKIGLDTPYQNSDCMLGVVCCRSSGYSHKCLKTNTGHTLLHNTVAFFPQI